MEIKILILLLINFRISLGQSISCLYTDILIDGEPNYTCYLNIQNQAGYDEFTFVDGAHEEGRNNDNVTALIVQNVSRTVNFPQILCSQFSNLKFVDYSKMGVVQISENTLNGCSRLSWLRFWSNELEEIHEHAFTNSSKLTYIDLDNNNLRSLPENVFDELENLEVLELTANPFDLIPSGLFKNLFNLKMLLLINVEIREMNPQWFINLGNLNILSLYGNSITSMPENIFENLTELNILELSHNPTGNFPANLFSPLRNLDSLFMVRNEIFNINPRWFDSLSDLSLLFIHSNMFTSLPENVFDNLINLRSLDIGNNHMAEADIPATTFDMMPLLNRLIMDFNLVQRPNQRWFARLTQLNTLNMDYNEIDELPNGIFASFENLYELDLWHNHLKTINRTSFGNLTSLYAVDLNSNVINAIDENFLNDASALNYLLLSNNICSSENFLDFEANRVTSILRLARCTNNFRFAIDTVTEIGDTYNFFDGPSPGIQIRVNAEENVNIALTPFDFPWTPMIEIFIGVANNIESRIVRNRQTVVVTVPTPNILRSDQWSGFRITWANHVILVTREGQQFPFMAYTLEDFFPVNFYGLRSPQNRAVWNIQPVEADVVPANV